MTDIEQTRLRLQLAHLEQQLSEAQVKVAQVQQAMLLELEMLAGKESNDS